MSSEKKFYFQTKLTPEEILYKLSNITSRKKFQLYIGGIAILPSKSFSGEFTNNSFVIKKNSIIHNSFRPEVHGEIISKNDVTILKLKPKINWVAILILFLILGALSLSFISTNLVFNHLYRLFGQESNFDNSSLWFILALDLIFPSVIYLVFRLESRWVLSDLKKLLNLSDYHNE